MRDSGSPVHILLVEDEVAHAEIVKRNLRDFNVANAIHHVSDGQEALDYLFGLGRYTDAARRQRPDLILLDLRLPKIDGIEVLDTLKRDPDLRAIPTIVLTTSPAEEDMARAYRGGAASYLVKPLDFSKFTELMKSFGFYWLLWNRFP